MIADDEVRAAVAYIRRHVVDGRAPRTAWFEATAVDAGLRSLSYFSRIGITYSDLVRKAGATPNVKAGRPVRRIDDALNAEIAKRQLECEPALYSSWPMQADVKRETTFTWQRTDGAVIRTTRQYCSLR